jgi:hypothetical protein
VKETPIEFSVGWKSWSSSKVKVEMAGWWSSGTSKRGKKWRTVLFFYCCCRIVGTMCGVSAPVGIGVVATESKSEPYFW